MFYQSIKFKDQFEPCECCRPKYVTATSTTYGHKYTEQEIKDEILYLANKLSSAKWYDRGEIRRSLKHWTDKLNRLNEYKEEFTH